MASFLGRTSFSNSVQPSRSDFSRRSSPSVPNNNEWSTEKLIEASRQLPARLEKLEQENKDLKQQLQSLRQSQESHSHDNRQLVAEVQRLKQRHAAMAERKVNMDQRRTENTLSTNRQSDLEKEYKNDFRDGKRVDAIEVIEEKQRKIRRKQQLSTDDQLKACRLACYIFEISYECALKARETFISYYSSLLSTLVTDAPAIGLSDCKHKLPDVKPVNTAVVSQDSLNEVMVLVKEAAGRKNCNLQKLVKVVRKEFKAKWREVRKKGDMLPSYDNDLKKDLQFYIEFCTQFAWRTVTQVPPLEIDCKTTTYNPAYHNESLAFSSSAKRDAPPQWASTQKEKRVKCYLWPTLYDCDKRVIEKGEVVLTEHINASTEHGPGYVETYI